MNYLDLKKYCLVYYTIMLNFQADIFKKLSKKELCNIKKTKDIQETMFWLSLNQKWEIISGLVQYKILKSKDFTELKKNGCCALSFICQSGNFRIVSKLEGWNKIEFDRIYNGNNSIKGWINFHKQQFRLSDIKWEQSIPEKINSLDSLTSFNKDNIESYQIGNIYLFDVCNYDGLSGNDYD